MMEQRDVQSYKKGSLSGQQLRSYVEEIWETLGKDGRTLEELQKMGIPAEQLSLAGSSPFIIEEKGNGFSATEVLITVAVHAVSAGTYDALKHIWLKSIAPRLKLRIDDAVGPPADT